MWSQVSFIFLCFALPRRSHGNKTWDYLVLAQKWPVTDCLWFECIPMPQPADFVIHGLWPTKFPNESPDNCSMGKPFDVKDILAIQSELERKWPNIRLHTKKMEFWEHEWSKHGRCALDNPLFPDELAYFSKALELYDRVPLLATLKAAGFVPDNDSIVKLSRDQTICPILEQVSLSVRASTSLDIQELFMSFAIDILTLRNATDKERFMCGMRHAQADDIKRAIQAKFGVRPAFTCMKHHHKAAYLAEVRICFSWDLDYMDCVDEQARSVNHALIGTNPCPDEFILPSVIPNSSTWTVFCRVMYGIVGLFSWYILTNLLLS